jgi:hypothetical protein
MTKARRAALLGSTTSRRNKMALLARCVADREYVEMRWEGQPYESRMLFDFMGGAGFIRAKSFDEDVLSGFKEK